MKEKKKFELSATEISLILYALSVVIVVLAYFAVFNPKMTEAKSIEAQNVSLQGTVTGLEGMVAREAEVIAETAAYKQEVQDIIAKYPADVPTEMAIKLIQDMQDINFVDVSDISISTRNMIGSVSNISGGEIAEANAAEGEEGSDTSEAASVATTGIGYCTMVALKYSAEYEAFKDLIYYIQNFDDRTTVPTVTMSYDSAEGMVSGTISIKMYYLTGTGKSYSDPVLEYQDMGVSNIFGNLIDSAGKRDAKNSANTETEANTEVAE